MQSWSFSCSQKSSDLDKGHLRVSWTVWYHDINNRSFEPCGLGLFTTDAVKSLQIYQGELLRLLSDAGRHQSNVRVSLWISHFTFLIIYSLLC